LPFQTISGITLGQHLLTTESHSESAPNNALGKSLIWKAIVPGKEDNVLLALLAVQTAVYNIKM
jgi:hypothetical protein